MEATATLLVSLDGELFARLRDRARARGFARETDYIVELCREDAEFDPAVCAKLREMVKLIKSAQ